MAVYNLSAGSGGGMSPGQWGDFSDLIGDVFGYRVPEEDASPGYDDPYTNNQAAITYWSHPANRERAMQRGRSMVRSFFGGGSPGEPTSYEGPTTADEADRQAYLEGLDVEERPFLGYGEQTDVVLRNQIPTAEPAATPDQARLRERFPDHPSNQNITVYGKPIYRAGDEFSFGTKLDANGRRRWQAFFSGLGFKTGPSGFWGPMESSAMQAFMTMANTAPGGGMTVNVLRQNVMRDVEQGLYFFRGINEEGDVLPTLLGEETVPDLDGGGIDDETGQSMEPFTQTVTERQIQQFSREQGMVALRSMVANVIGRKPNDDEVKQFVRQLNATARDDPTVITSVTTTDPVTGESESTRTVEESSVDIEASAVEFSDEVSPEEKREYQAGRYFDALMSEIGI